MSQAMSSAVKDILARAEILTVEEFKQLSQAFNELAEARAQARKDLARAEILAIADSVGMPVMELLQDKRATRPAKKVAAKYANPQDSSDTWTGRGRAPKWAQDLKDAGLLDSALLGNSAQGPQ